MDVRTLWFMLLALTASTNTFAQEAAQPKGRFYGPLVSGWAAKLPAKAPQVNVPAPSSDFSRR